MATAARPAPSLQVTAPADVMDLHSDVAPDHGDGDGDIEIDLWSTGQQDDDLSLHDAGTDAGLDVQTVSADHDDFMADHEDLIEDDIIIYDNDIANDSNQQSIHDSVAEQSTTINVEDELIDYSDDEDEASGFAHGNASNPAETQADADVPTEGDDVEHTFDTGSLGPEPTTTHDSVAQDLGGDAHQGGVADNDTEQQHAEVSQYAPPQHGDCDSSQEHRQFHESQGHEDGPSVDVETDVQSHRSGEVVGDGPDVSSGSRADHEQSKHQQEVYLHQVTVNYDGAELWLFKHHDVDGSGDYLLEDDSPANQPMSSLLEACRSAIGSDVTDDMELGFRLDHFHNIELWQEHSSCAFVTLEQMVSLYLQLHAQDGTNNPESFYMTLIFRPRVSMLINELKKAAAEGIGHSGLARAIAAGQTAFSARLSHDSTENVYDDWQHDAQGQELDSHNVGVTGEGENEEVAQAEDDHEELREEHEEEHHDTHHEENDIEESLQPTVNSPNNEAPALPRGSNRNTPAGADGRTTPSDANPVPQTLAYRSPSGSQHSPGHEADDLLDYSDDEDNAEAPQPDQTHPSQPSSSSSTVQGDDHKANNQDQNVQSFDGAEYAEDAVADAYEYDGDNAPEGSAQDEVFDYQDGLDQADEDNFADAQELEIYEEAQDENTNHYDDFEAQDVDQSGSVAPMGAEATSLDDFIGIDNFLDFESVAAAADESTTDQVGGSAQDDLINFDDEDGEEGQAPVTASVGAEPVAGSSSGLQGLSPQGQKRKIDEAGNDAGEATDSSDAKRPRV